MRTRFLKEADLVERLRRLAAGETTEAAVRQWLRRQPEFPAFVGATEATRIMAVHPPHLARLRASGALRDFEVEGGHPIFLRADVERLAGEIAEARARRAKARDERLLADLAKTAGAI